MSKLVVFNGALDGIAWGYITPIADQSMIAVLIKGGWEPPDDPSVFDSFWYLDDVPSAALASEPAGVSGLAVQDGRVMADPTTFPNVPPGPDITGVLTAVQDEFGATLVSFHGLRLDTREVNVTPNGTSITVTWAPAGVFSI